LGLRESLKQLVPSAYQIAQIIHSCPRNVGKRKDPEVAIPNTGHCQLSIAHHCLQLHNTEPALA